MTDERRGSSQDPARRRLDEIGAPDGWGESDGPALPRGVPEPGDLPAIGDLYEPSETTDTAIYDAALEAEGAGADPGRYADPLLSLELRDDETTDPIVAMEEGLPYVAPSDPVVSGTQGDGDPIVASGFSASALDEPYDLSHHSDDPAGDSESEMNDRVREALRADAQTTAYADTVEIAVVGGRVVVAGPVDDLDDADAILAVAERARGVTEVEDRLTVAAVDEPGLDNRGEAAAE